MKRDIFSAIFVGLVISLLSIGAYNLASTPACWNFTIFITLAAVVVTLFFYYVFIRAESEEKEEEIDFRPWFVLAIIFFFFASFAMLSPPGGFIVTKKPQDSTEQLTVHGGIYYDLNVFNKQHMEIGNFNPKISVVLKAPDQPKKITWQVKADLDLKADENKVLNLLLKYDTKENLYQEIKGRIKKAAEAKIRAVFKEKGIVRKPELKLEVFKEKIKGLGYNLSQIKVESVSILQGASSE